MKFLEKQLEKRPVLAVGGIAVLAVALASATGILGQIAAPLARAVNAIKARLGGGAAKAFWVALAVGSAVAAFLLPDVHGVALAGLTPALWGFSRLATEPWPIRGAQSQANPVPVRFDLKRYLTDELISSLYVRVVGSITKVGAAAGTATGRDNPEALVTEITARSVPSMGVVSKSRLTARGILRQSIFDGRGYGIFETDISDAAETVSVDFRLPLQYKLPGAQVPVEFGLPLKAFQSYVVEVTCGGRDQLFTGGTPPTWNMDAVNVELWAKFDRGVAGTFHMMEEFSQIVEVTQSRTDLPVDLPEGFVYTSLLFLAERDNVLVNDIINAISVESAGRSWLPHGTGNAAMIQRSNRDEFISNPSESQTGIYYVPANIDGMLSRALDMKFAKPNVRLDVTLGGGTVRRVIVHGRRVIPQALNVS